MKKLVLISVFAVLGMAAHSQTTYSSSSNISEWGTSADTLTASAVDTLDFNIKGYGICTLVLKTDSVSGTPAYEAVLYKAIEGYDYVSTGDTITHSGGADNQAYFTTFNVNCNAYRIVITATAAEQKSNLTLAGIFRKQY